MTVDVDADEAEAEALTDVEVLGKIIAHRVRRFE
jgi:hypothetical protein